MKIVWLKSALVSLLAVRQYIESDNPRAAEKVADRIEESVKMLAEFPLCGHVGTVDGTRELVLPQYPYIIVYRVKHNEVQILRIFHQKQSRH